MTNAATTPDRDASSPGRSRKARLIFNPTSGTSTPPTASADEIVALLRAHRIAAEVVNTVPDQSPAALARTAADDGCDLVVVCGGDGTVSEVCTGMIESRIPIGIIPAGTFNNIARSLCLPVAVEAACAVIGNGQVRMMDVGLANEEKYFFEAAGVGLDAALFPLGEEIKGGRWSRLFHLLQTSMNYRVEPIEIEFDTSIAEASLNQSRRFLRRRRVGRDTHRLRAAAMLVVVANGPYYGSGFLVAPGASMSDGKLTVSLYRGFSKWQLFRHFWSIANGRQQDTPKLESYTARQVTISSPAPLPVHADGHPLRQLPVTLRTVPAALKVFAPPAAAPS